MGMSTTTPRFAGVLRVAAACAALAAACLVAHGAAVVHTEFRPGQVWTDVAGQPINAHGGGVLHHNGQYYWYGEIKTGKTWLPEANRSWGGTRVEAVGVSCYSSRDLYNWRYEGNVLPAVQADASHELHSTKVLERPKVVYNRATKRFVMWLHVDSEGYSLAHAGVAVSDSPTGPFRYLGSLSPNGAMSRDITVFVDDDGQAYLAWGNKIFFTAKLDDDMIHLKGETYTTDASGKMQNRKLGTAKILAHPPSESADWKTYEEAPWLTKRGSLYYLVFASGFPETINYATATSPEGPWQFRGVVIARESTDASTIHSCLFDFRGASYMGYHTKELPTGSDYRRAQCMDRVYYNADGTLKKMVRTHK